MFCITVTLLLAGRATYLNHLFAQDTGTRFGMAHTEMIDMRDLCSMVGVTDKEVVSAPEVVGCVLCIMSSSSIAVKDALAAICDGPRKTP